ncbi:hypothetical protein [Methylobacterium soli]|uniref:Uncharacterized protein n=1 Tax=Methylobacterium soli TaxID=553447 RepID=A0A6L3SZ32_9HYPH|nr:hypothetical protein [Methylobacterium soli]KAB1075433.1 hypothetical protein F6X53_25040 [Methylobacterium soli]GJE41331.1 hypothetical protein AEGHOMDF_0495 [Methylobacterium soli]
MTTSVIVIVPASASYVARVTTFQTAHRHEEDVQPGTERTFWASSGCTFQVAEAPIAASESLGTASSVDTATAERISGVLASDEPRHAGGLPPGRPHP